MRKFIKLLLLFFLVPVFILVGLYLLADPFKTLGKFDLKNFSDVNREYVSLELFLKNYPTQEYNSFVFGSSRACGLNLYTWKMYLPNDAKPFLFQAWAETITGVYQKLVFLQNKKVEIRDVIILIDIPSTFREDQEPIEALSIKDYRLSGKPFLYNQAMLFYAYLKPSMIYKSIVNVNKPSQIVSFDTITNDWSNLNLYRYNKKPIQDSTLSKESFLHLDRGVTSPPIINEVCENTLLQIKKILKEQSSNYKIVITPSYTQISINQNDLDIINQIFGPSNVYNFSGVNSISNNKYNFTDINHFDYIGGWIILELLYSKDNPMSY